MSIIPANPSRTETHVGNEGIPMPFTNCFCLCGDDVLLLRGVKALPEGYNRHFFVGMLNGLGGKFQNGEPPEECNRREVWEESEEIIDLSEDTPVRFAGYVTWSGFNGASPETYEGMYIFVAQLPPSEKLAALHHCQTREGRLEWHNRHSVVESPDLLPHLRLYLPLILDTTIPLHCHFVFDGDRVVSWDMQIVETAPAS